MNIIGHRYLFLLISGILMLVSAAALAAWGLKLGIDFTGGSLMEVSFEGARPRADLIRAQFTNQGAENASVQLADECCVIARFRAVDEETHQRILAGLGSLGQVTERRFDAVGPSIGAELGRRALLALALALGAIIAYVAYAFRRVSRPVASWKYGAAALVALLHDVLIPSGVFAALGRFRGVEVDALFVTALLTIVGFSVHDTIVVFDRTRENLRSGADGEHYGAIVNRSLNETMRRSLFTSLTVLLVLAAVLIFGGVSTRWFALALMIGIVFGTYSSIFVASPILVVWNKMAEKKRRRLFK